MPMNATCPNEKTPDVPENVISETTSTRLISPASVALRTGVGPCEPSRVATATTPISTAGTTAERTILVPAPGTDEGAAGPASTALIRA